MPANFLLALNIVQDEVNILFEILTHQMAREDTKFNAKHTLQSSAITNITQ